MTTLTAEGKIAPGLHRGVSFDEYGQWPAANHSMLEQFRRSAAHARQWMLTGGKETPALRNGWAVHVAALEPDRFASDFTVAPKVDRRTKDGKQAWADFEESPAGKLLRLSDEEMHLCLNIRETLYAHPTAAEILSSKGTNEASLYWHDPETGLDCKARFDRLCVYAGWSCVVDLKTTKDASRRTFEYSIHRYGYHRQAAMYLEGANVVAPRDRKFIWIAVETEPPYCVAVYEADPDCITLGRDDYRKHLRTYAECMATGRWPGYGDGMDYASVPPWAFRAVEGE